MKRFNVNFIVICIVAMSVSAISVTRDRLDYLLSELKSQDEARISKASIELSRLGPKANEVLPDILTMIRNDEIFFSSRIVLHIARDEPVEKLLEMVKDENSIVRSSAMQCLKYKELDDDSTIKLYSDLLDHSDPYVSLSAVEALQDIEAEQLCYERIIELAYHEDEFVNSVAISAIERLKKSTKQIKQVLSDYLECSEKKQEVIRAAAVYQNFYPVEQKGLKLLKSLVKDKNEQVRRDSLYALGKVKVIDQQTKQLIRKYVNDEDMGVSSAACFAVIKHDIGKERAWGRINALLEKDKLSVLLVLMRLGADAKPLQKGIMKLMDDEEDFIQAFAIRMLCKIEHDKEALLPILKGKLKETESFTVWHVVKLELREIENSD